VDLLNRARALGDRLVVGLNSDNSIRQLKGANRPINDQESRKAVLEGLSSVDEVIIFDDLTPQDLIERVKPDVLVKGGDWPVEQIIGSSFVIANGGEVHSLPLKGDHSTSSLLERIRNEKTKDSDPGSDIVQASLDQHRETFNKIFDTLGPTIDEAAKLLVKTFANGNKVLICGNGGSAADAQHIAAEFVGRYETERIALPSIALTTDTSALTALANDYDFQSIFARQVEALARPGDCLIAISTSGNSPNVIAAVIKARDLGCRILGFTGENGKRLAGLSDVCISIPSSRTARIQEGHITVAHILCEIVDARVTDGTITAQ